MTLPKKLKKDSILEAICEIRFETDDLAEVVLGRITAIEQWKNYSQKRAPIADIPLPIRLSDEQLKHQATIELRDKDNLRLVRIGSNVFAYNNVNSYMGWDTYFREIKTALKEVTESVRGLKITRIGLRYINVLNSKDHLIDGLDSLNIGISIKNESISNHVNLNYGRTHGNDLDIVVRITTPEFLKKPPENMTVMVDIDVSAVKEKPITSFDDLIDWIDRAHSSEKEEFFRLFKEETLKQIAER